MPHSSRAHDQVFRAAAVGSQGEIFDRSEALGTYQGRTGRIAEYRPVAFVARMQMAGIGLGGDQQDVAGDPGTYQAFGQGQAVHITGAAQVEIQCTYRSGQPQTILYQTGRGRQKIIRALCAEQQIVHFRTVDSVLGEQFFRCRHGQIRGAFVLTGDMTAGHAYLGGDFFHRPFGKFPDQHVIGYDRLGKMIRLGFYVCVHSVHLF